MDLGSRLSRPREGCGSEMSQLEIPSDSCLLFCATAWTGVKQFSDEVNLLRMNGLWSNTQNVMVIGHSSYLEKPAENDNNALDKGPPRDVVPIGKQEVVVSGLQASGQLLELAHHLNPFVNT